MKKEKQQIGSPENARLALAEKLLLEKIVDEEIDIAYQLQTIRAIIATNEEIWERCSSRRVLVDDKEEKVVKMIKSGYFKIFVEGHSMKIKHEFITETFPDLPKIPEDLAELVTPNLDPVSSSTILPNYKEYFDRVFLLHDDVLGPYLVKLKDYFEEVQVYLGKIEAWIMSTQTCLDFINSIFEEDEIKLLEGKVCGDLDRGHNPTDYYMCQCCGRTLTHHKDGNCKQSPNSSKEEVDVGLFLYIYSLEKTVLEWSAGEYKQTFNITLDDDREKVKKFVEFLKLCAE